MKVNIEMEGTPQEVSECLKLIGQTGANVKIPNQWYPATTSPTIMPWESGTQITSGSITWKKGKCPNDGHPCYCTGACNKIFGQTLDVRI